MSTFKEIVEYCMRRLASFEKMLSPPKPKTKPIDAVDYGKDIQVVHVHHYHHEVREEPMGRWETIYRNLLKGF